MAAIAIASRRDLTAGNFGENANHPIALGRVEPIIAETPRGNIGQRGHTR